MLPGAMSDIPASKLPLEDKHIMKEALFLFITKGCNLLMCLANAFSYINVTIK